MEKTHTAIFYILSFAGLFVFFVFLHPQVLLDYDDWGNIVVLRLPLPLPNYWNPSRVFPELFYPVSGFVAGGLNAVFPSLGFVRAESLVIGTVLSILVVIYQFLFSKVLEKRLSVPVISAQWMSAVFLLLHFLIFRSSDSGNLHLFMSTNASCCYYYLMSAVINCSLVMYLMIRKRERNAFARILFYAAVYFAVFSNQFGSIVSAAYAFCMIVSGLIDGKNKKESFKKTVIKQFDFILIDFLWMLSLIIDAVGGRGRDASGGQSALSSFSLNGMPNPMPLLRQLNIPFMIILFAGLVIPIVRAVLKRQTADEKRLVVPVCCSFVITTVYLFLLCAKVLPHYICRTEVIFGIAFYLIFLSAAGLAKLLSNIRDAEPWVIAALAALIFSLTNTQGRTFSDSYCESIDSKTCLAISEYVVKQVADADNSGNTDVAVHVIQSLDDPEYNWPQHMNLGEPLSKALYRFKVTDRPMNIQIIPDGELNKQFGVNF